MSNSSTEGEYHVQIQHLRDKMRVRIALIALVTYLHVTVGELRTEFRDEFRNINASLDRVETKIDEVRGHLKYSADSTKNDTPPGLR